MIAGAAQNVAGAAASRQVAVVAVNVRGKNAPGSGLIQT